MSPTEIQTALSEIWSTTDEVEKTLKLSGLVGSLFRERGWEMVVVGGSAIEVYTEGRYMSGDIDMCARSEVVMPPPRVRAEVMRLLGATGGPRNFRLRDRWIDLLGRVERMSKALFQHVETPYGLVALMPVEELLVDKVFTSVHPQTNDEERACAEKLMAVCVSGHVAINWDEAAKMAASKEYGVGPELEQLRQQITLKLAENERPQNIADLGRMEKGSNGPAPDI